MNAPLVGELEREVKGFLTTWRERSAERRAAEPPHTDVEALRLSLLALDEAFAEHREFSWACSSAQKRAALDGSIARSVGGLSL